MSLCLYRLHQDIYHPWTGHLDTNFIQEKSPLCRGSSHFTLDYQNGKITLHYFKTFVKSKMKQLYETFTILSTKICLCTHTRIHQAEDVLKKLNKPIPTHTYALLEEGDCSLRQRVSKQNRRFNTSSYETKQHLKESIKFKTL